MILTPINKPQRVRGGFVESKKILQPSTPQIHQHANQVVMVHGHVHLQGTGMEPLTWLQDCHKIAMVTKGGWNPVASTMRNRKKEPPVVRFLLVFG